jgi:hypothetical protein
MKCHLSILLLSLSVSCVPVQHSDKQTQPDARLVDVQDLLTAQCLAVEAQSNALLDESNKLAGLKGKERLAGVQRIRVIEHQMDSTKKEVEHTREEMARVHQQLGH